MSSLSVRDVFDDALRDVLVYEGAVLAYRMVVPVPERRTIDLPTISDVVWSVRDGHHSVIVRWAPAVVIVGALLAHFAYGKK